MISLKHSSSSPSRNESPLVWLLTAAAAVTAGILLLIVFFLVRESWPVLASTGGGRFLSDDGWHPTEGSFGLSPMLWATVIASIGAVLLATPLGVASAVFCQFYARGPLARLYRALIALLAGVPSVVYGLWGLTVLVPLIASVQPPGPSLLAAILILSLMILPTVALTADATLGSVPESYSRGAAALGLSREAIIVRVVLPAARAGITAGVLLASARALGETMAVLMVSGNVVQMPSDLFDPVRTLTANIALEMAYATGGHRSALFVSGLALMTLVLALSGLAWRRGGGSLHV
jgi:phosphate transport system permease protein